MLSQPKAPRLIATTAFDNETGDLQTGKHAGLIAWSREGNPSVAYGEPTTLFAGGDVPDME
ncbi:hypothetical protein [Mesorhizobium sp. WSM1497]|uniref:hypothetical protein n=1 Tax=Mesorhizobium sp. WSM1497 TaxID=278153 RepID=UPI0007EC9BD5|nr:hypothetical protein [Mesorhizobium sp. WSM1497]